MTNLAMKQLHMASATAALPQAALLHGGTMG